MTQADKFEFKSNALPIDFDRENKKNKICLIEYKQLIVQLYQTVTDLNGKLENLQSNMSKRQQQNKCLEEAIGNMKQSYSSLQKKYQQQCEKNWKMKDNLDMQIQKCMEKQQNIKQLNFQIQKTSKNYDSSLLKVRQLQDILQEKQTKLYALQQKIASITIENNDLKSQIYHKQHQKQWEVKELRNLSEEIKKKFSEVSFESPPSVKQFIASEEKTSVTPKYGRSMSTQKKTRRNNGFLINHYDKSQKMNNMISHNKSTFTKQERFKRGNIANPQITQQLLNIKSEIANQYTLINLKKENYNKERVARTLDQLQLRMKKMIKNAQQSQISSCCE